MATNNADNFSNPIGISTGGTGISSTVAYTPLVGGTTSTGPLQSVASLGSSTNVLTSNGSAIPSFQANTTNSLVLISSKTATAAASVTFTTGITGTYNTYVLVVTCTAATVSNLLMTVSTNGGSTYVSTGYLGGEITYQYNSATITQGGNQTTAFSLGTNLMRGLTCYLFNVTSGAKMSIVGQGGGTNDRWFFGGSCGTATVNALKLVPSTGTFTGIFTLFGILE